MISLKDQRAMEEIADGFFRDINNQWTFTERELLIQALQYAYRLGVFSTTPDRDSE